MAKVALVLRQNLPGFSIVDDYYLETGREPTDKGALPVDRVETFNNTFKHLAETLREKKRSHVVVVVHGTPEVGLIMPIAAETKVSAGACMLDLVRMVDQLDDTGGKSVTNALVGRVVNAWSIKENTARSLADTCWQIRRSPGTCVAVHVRGCDIGQWDGIGDSHIRLLQKLFASAVVSAPICPMFFVGVKPGVAKQGIEAYAKKVQPEGRRYIYRRPSIGPLLLDIRYLGDKSEQHSAVENQDDVKAWASELQETTSAAKRSFPIAGLWPAAEDDYYLAHEPGYVNRLRSARKA